MLFSCYVSVLFGAAASIADNLCAAYNHMQLNLFVSFSTGMMTTMRMHQATPPVSNWGRGSVMCKAAALPQVVGSLAIGVQASAAKGMEMRQQQHTICLAWLSTHMSTAGEVQRQKQQLSTAAQVLHGSKSALSVILGHYQHKVPASTTLTIILSW